VFIVVAGKSRTVCTAREDREVGCSRGTNLSQTQACSSASSSQSDIIQAVRESKGHANDAGLQANIKKAINALGERLQSKKRS
jgi:hypothetical protein